MPRRAWVVWSSDFEAGPEVIAASRRLVVKSLVDNEAVTKDDLLPGQRLSNFDAVVDAAERNGLTVREGPFVEVRRHQRRGRAVRSHRRRR